VLLSGASFNEATETRKGRRTGPVVRVSPDYCLRRRVTARPASRDREGQGCWVQAVVQQTSRSPQAVAIVAERSVPAGRPAIGADSIRLGTAYRNFADSGRRFIARKARQIGTRILISPPWAQPVRTAPRSAAPPSQKQGISLQANDARRPPSSSRKKGECKVCFSCVARCDSSRGSAVGFY